MSDKPEPGSLVRLNSGSPDLTVFAVRDDGVVEVEWFDGAEVRRDAFPQACLRPVPSWISAGRVRFVPLSEMGWA